MSCFPLLRLPELARINVLQKAEVIDLVTLSFCSHKAKKLVRLAKVKLDDLTFNFYDSQFLIGVNNKTFWVQQYFGTSKVNLENEADEILYTLLETSESLETVAFLVIGHLMDTFRRIDNISVRFNLDNLPNLPVWNYRKTIKNLKIFPNFIKTANEEMMNFILDKLNVTGHFTFIPTVAVGYQYSNGFQQERVTIYNADWVHFNAVLHSRSRYICFYEVPLPPITQLQTFLKLWMDKTHMENLNKLEMKWKSEGFTDSSFQQIINGIEHERLHSMIIKVRRIDGKAATVDVSWYYFKFRVIN